MNIYDGFGFIWERPATAILLLLSVLLIFLPAIRSRLALRRQKFTRGMLSGIKMDLTNVLAGPFCCHQLAHMGAEVSAKIELAVET